MKRVVYLLAINAEENLYAIGYLITLGTTLTVTALLKRTLFFLLLIPDGDRNRPPLLPREFAGGLPGSSWIPPSHPSIMMYSWKGKQKAKAGVLKGY